MTLWGLLRSFCIIVAEYFQLLFKLLISCIVALEWKQIIFWLTYGLNLTRNCQSGLWGLFQETDFWGGGWWEGEVLSAAECHGIWMFLVVGFCKNPLKKWKLFNVSLNFVKLLWMLLFSYGKFYYFVSRMWHLEFLLYVVKCGLKILRIVE